MARKSKSAKAVRKINLKSTIQAIKKKAKVRAKFAKKRFR